MSHSTGTEYGKFQLEDGMEFHWMVNWDSRKPEVYGHVQTRTGRILKGYSGWYRTHDPENALAIVRFKMGDQG